MNRGYSSNTEEEPASVSAEELRADLDHSRLQHVVLSAALRTRQQCAKIAGMSDDLVAALNQDFKEREAKDRTQQRAAWHRFLDEAPPRARRRVKRGVSVGLEVQPHRWLTAGLDVLRSAHVVSRVQLMNGVQGPPIHSVLPYPVFQFGTELFLKGMFLCQYPACRRVAQNDYVPFPIRERVDKKLHKLGHDLLGIIERLKRAERCRTDPTSMQFLRRVSAVVRVEYYPLHQAGRRSWADARYPKRFYDDAKGVGHADSLSSYPEQRLIFEDFESMSRHIDQLWNLRRELIEQKKRRTP